ncbi:MAG: DNA-binding domain-containing protein [Legionellales bacterium]|nr:DNA-binding domain-containing protein [Legionellales bacterium]
MNTLLTIEQQFQNHLFHGSEDILPHVIGTNKVPVEVRLGIYRNAYRWRLHDAIASTYPITQCCLEDDSFEALCYDYIDAHPSQFRSIRWFGDHFASFLKNHPSTQDKPYLAELALFEWTLALSFDAPDRQIITLQDMHQIPPESWATLCFTLHPSIHFLTFSWNVVAMWQESTKTQTQSTLHLLESPLPWILWREGLETLFSSLMADEAWAIESLRNGGTFGDLCEGLCQWMDEEQAAHRAASLLKGWITAGLITEVTR